MAKEKFVRNKPHVNIGTIGEVNVGTIIMEQVVESLNCNGTSNEDVTAAIDRAAASIDQAYYDYYFSQPIGNNREPINGINASNYTNIEILLLTIVLLLFTIALTYFMRFCYDTCKAGKMSIKPSKLKKLDVEWDDQEARKLNQVNDI